MATSDLYDGSLRCQFLVHFIHLSAKTPQKPFLHYPNRLPLRRLQRLSVALTRSSSFAKLNEASWLATRRRIDVFHLILPAIPKGAPNPAATCTVSLRPSCPVLGERTHESPVPQPKEPCQRIEGQIAARAFRVVIWAGHAGAGGMEAAAGNEDRCGGGSESGQHLRPFSQASKRAKCSTYVCVIPIVSPRVSRLRSQSDIQ